MKFIDNIVRNIIIKQIKEIDFKEVLTTILEEHGDEIKEAIEKLVKEAVTGVIDKIK